MLISVKCNDCKNRWTMEFSDSGVNPSTEPLRCKFCYSDALLAEHVRMIDHPTIRLYARLAFGVVLAALGSFVFFSCKHVMG